MKLHEDIDHLPHNNHAIFFYGSVFSQWARSSFVLHGTKYSCAEQYMMACKARLFGDQEALRKIMASHDPSVQKAIGRQVKGFNAEAWEKVAKKLVTEANVAKFSQNEQLKEILLSTGEMMIVEASPTDCIWGIGLDQTDPRIFDLNSWRGHNWLGLCIMEARDIIRGRKQ